MAVQEFMDIKSRVVTEIDRLLSGYIEEKKNALIGTARRDAIFGGIDALKMLQKRVEAIKVARYKTMRIVEESSADFQVIRPASSFLSEVLLRIESTPRHIREYGQHRSRVSQDAISGRIEACNRVREFVYQLDAELVNCE